MLLAIFRSANCKVGVTKYRITVILSYGITCEVLLTV